MKVKLVVVSGANAGMEIPISTPEFLVGQGEHCQLRSQDELVSHRHCAISVAKGSATIEDCGSGKDTLLNGKRIQWRRELHDGDRITIGALVLEVRLAADEDGEMWHGIPKGRDVACGTVAADDVKAVRWVEEGQGDGVDAHGKSASSPVAESLAIQNADGARVMADTPDACVSQDRRIEPLDAQTARTKMDLIDLWLMAAIVVLGVLIVVLLVPMFSEAGPAVRRVYRAVVRFRHWPWWIWTTCGVLLLGALLWLRERFE